MFRIIRNGSNRLDIDYRGELDSESMRAALGELIEKSKDIENRRMLYLIGNFSLPTPAAIGAELSRLPEWFRFIKKFDRAAVVTDNGWIQKLGGLEGDLFPGLEIKAFDEDEGLEAEVWLATGQAVENYQPARYSLKI
jgi:hypothetical protein